jgi:hypothetical protein
MQYTLMMKGTFLVNSYPIMAQLQIVFKNYIRSMSSHPQYTFAF